MYQTGKYAKQDRDFQRVFIEKHPFATVVMQGDRLLGTHLPILTEGKEDDFRLFGHLAKFNPMFKYMKDGIDLLLIFQGAHAYISPSWYEEPNVGTWDYSAVHVNAKLKIQTETELRSSLDLLVHHFEKEEKNPLFLSQVPAEKVDAYIPQILGFWCLPYKIEGVAKLHQGYSARDIRNIAEELKKRKDTLSAELANDLIRENTDENQN